MGQCVIMTNTYPGIDPDECTAKREHILTGYKAGVNGEEDPVAGTMHHLTNESAIQHESGNATKVIKADERFIGNNTDGVRRMSLRYNGTPGYIAGNTLVGLPAQTKTITPSTSQQTIGPDGGKLLENVVVNAIPNNRGVGAHGVSSGVNAQGLYYYIPSGWYPADNSGNSWVYRTLPEVANTIGLTADKIKRGVTVGGVAGTCDWAENIGWQQGTVFDGEVTPMYLSFTNIQNTMPYENTFYSGMPFSQYEYIVVLPQLRFPNGYYSNTVPMVLGTWVDSGTQIFMSEGITYRFDIEIDNHTIKAHLGATSSKKVTRVTLEITGGTSANLT